MLSFSYILTIYFSGILVLTLVLLIELNSNRFTEETRYSINKEPEEVVSPKLYLVHSPSCKIPNLNPFDKSLFEFLRREPHTNCFSHPPLTEVSFNPKTKETSLTIDRNSLRFYTQGDFISCCIFPIREPYHYIKLRKPMCFSSSNGSLLLNKKLQLLIVKCYDSGHEQIYENRHATVVRPRRIKRKMVKNKLNVLLIGLDSISRLNLYRTIPQTVTYLHTHGWTEMRGYTKVADNTLPNLMALLTGIPPDKILSPHREFFDGYPFIWKEFAAAGYVTAFAEDNRNIGTFEGNLKGFYRKPTDYYPLAFFTYSGKDLLNGPTKNCLGLKSPSDHVFAYLLDFARAYKRDPFFGLFWVNDFSHNSLNQPSSEDNQVLRTLQELENQGTLNTTMVLFLSDHGLRVGRSRHTKIGYYEDRLPFLFVSLPEWYKTENYKDYTNLLNNAEKLTSHFDLYKTLSHVLFGNELKDPIGCKTCHSLLEEIPNNRSCLDAGISSHWCACHELQDLHENHLKARPLAELVVTAINKRLEREEDLVIGYICAPLRVEKVLYVRRKLNTTEHVVGFRTYPGGAELEGTVVDGGEIERVEDSVSRLNNFGCQSHCARNTKIKILCYCVDGWN